MSDLYVWSVFLTAVWSFLLALFILIDALVYNFDQWGHRIWVCILLLLTSWIYVPLVIHGVVWAAVGIWGPGGLAGGAR